MEQRVADLGDAVAALRLAQPPPTSSSGEDGQAGAASGPQPATHDADFNDVADAASLPHGSTNHGVFNLPRGLSAASFQTPPPIQANGQYV